MKHKKALAISALVLAILLTGLVSANAIKNQQLEKQIELGNKYVEDGEYEQAILAYQEAVNIDPRNVDVRVGLAEAYIGNGDYDAAAETITVAQDLGSLTPQQFQELINAYIKQGKYEEAEKLLAIAQAKYKDDSTLKTVASDLKAEKEKAEAAKAPVEPAPVVVPVQVPQPEPVIEEEPTRYVETSPPAKPKPKDPGGVTVIY